MRRIARLDRSINLLRPRVPAQASSHYLCSACKHRSTAFSTSAIRAARDKLPFTEKVRRKIWGTEQPPGQEDPYGEASVFDQTKKRGNELARGSLAETAEERAARKQSTVLDSSYEAASTWDGLKQVGGFEEWWRNTWDPEHQFKGFLSKKVMKDNDEISVAVHRAVVEVLALKQAGVKYGDVSKAEPGGDLTQGIQVVLSPTGAPTLQFPDSVSLEDIIQSLAPPEAAPTESEEDVTADKSEEDPLHPEETSTMENPTESEEDVAADRSTEDPLKDASAETYHAVVASWNPSWLQVSLDNRRFKFAVLKRTMQLTGIRFPDSAIKSTADVQSLLSHLVKPPKPRKLVQALVEKEELMELPNVHVYKRRITSIDKEKQVGRWKVIEQELKERDLPITGHR